MSKARGEIKNGAGMLNEYGEIVRDCWNNLSYHYPNARLDEFVVMPNHVHGIMAIDNDVGNGFKPFPTKLINKANRQTIEAFLEKGVWKIGGSDELS